MILGVVGLIGSGKDTVADYIAKKYGYELVSFRDIVAETVESRGLIANRENMQKISRELRDKHGEDYFSKKALEKGMKLVKKGRKVLFKEMRTEGDVKILKDEFKDKIKIIKIDTDEKIRFARIKTRARKGDPKTLNEFVKQQKKEEDLHYTDSLKFADMVIKNNGPRKELYEEIDKAMRKLL